MSTGSFANPIKAVSSLPPEIYYLISLLRQISTDPAGSVIISSGPGWKLLKTIYIALKTCFTERESEQRDCCLFSVCPCAPKQVAKEMGKGVGGGGGAASEINLIPLFIPRLWQKDLKRISNGKHI